MFVPDVTVLHECIGDTACGDQVALMFFFLPASLSRSRLALASNTLFATIEANASEERQRNHESQLSVPFGTVLATILQFQPQPAGAQTIGALHLL